jgi:hypothetical protein
MLERLRPHPHRGDTIAAGAVPLSVAAILIDVRMGQWAVGARFAVVGLIAVLILMMGWLAPLEQPKGPRAYHSILLVAGLLPLAVALLLLASVLGAHGGTGAIAWTFGVEACVAVAAARRANSAICTLIGALAGAIAVEAFVYFAFSPHGIGTFRAFLLVLTVGLGVGAVRLRDRRRRHAVQLINVGGVLTVVLALTLAVQALGVAIASSLNSLGGTKLRGVELGAPGGWKLYIAAVAFGLVAYAAADREPGPGYLGVVNLVALVLLVGLTSGHTLVGWPLVLLVAGGAGLAVGLRPREPLPPEPPTRPLPPEPLETLD